MKVRQNYINFYFVQLFNCSVFIIVNIVIIFIYVLYLILFIDFMVFILFRDKNKLCVLLFFSQFGLCRVVIDCIDIEIVIFGFMSQQNVMYLNYRGMYFFKVIVGVALNGVIIYVSKFYLGLIFDKVIVQKLGFLNYFIVGDMVLVDKGFVIQDFVLNGVLVNILFFLNNGIFIESEVRVIKVIVKCRIYVERVNVRFKDFKILFFIFLYLCCYVDIIF